MDSHKDIFDWPHAWSRDIHPDVISQLTPFNAIYPNLDYWTYDNHFTHFNDPTPQPYIVDIYWSEDDSPYERLQLPPPVGDHVSSLLAANKAEEIRSMIWNHRIWIYEFQEWQDYGGVQGDFVDHIHIEWRQEAIS